MNFSSEWNTAYGKNTNLSIWPWTDLISYVKKFVNLNKMSRVLELGCGAGANIPFFTSLGVEYCAIDGSNVVVTQLKSKFPNLKNSLVSCDFTENIPFTGTFDLIVDRSSLTHNSLDAISNCVNLIEKKLTTNGIFIGIDWFSMVHSEYNYGERFEDDFTRCNFKTGQFKNIGKIHFSDKSHLQEIFKNFNFKILEHKIVKKEIPLNKNIFASWNFVLEKK